MADCEGDRRYSSIPAGGQLEVDLCGKRGRCRPARRLRHAALHLGPLRRRKHPAARSELTVARGFLDALEPGATGSSALVVTGTGQLKVGGRILDCRIASHPRVGSWLRDLRGNIASGAGWIAAPAPVLRPGPAPDGRVPPAPRRRARTRAETLIYQDLGDSAAAVLMLPQALTRDPRDRDAILELGTHHYRQVCGASACDGPATALSLPLSLARAPPDPPRHSTLRRLRDRVMVPGL